MLLLGFYSTKSKNNLIQNILKIFLPNFYFGTPYLLNQSILRIINGIFTISSPRRIEWCIEILIFLKFNSENPKFFWVFGFGFENLFFFGFLGSIVWVYYIIYYKDEVVINGSQRKKSF